MVQLGHVQVQRLAIGVHLLHPASTIGFVRAIRREQQIYGVAAVIVNGHYDHLRSFFLVA